MDRSKGVRVNGGLLQTRAGYLCVCGGSLLCHCWRVCVLELESDDRLLRDSKIRADGRGVGCLTVPVCALRGGDPSRGGKGGRRRWIRLTQYSPLKETCYQKAPQHGYCILPPTAVTRSKRGERSIH